MAMLTPRLPKPTDKFLSRRATRQDSTKLEESIPMATLSGNYEVILFIKYI